jgi:hypothetical protein
MAWEPKPANPNAPKGISIGLEGPPGGGKSCSALLLAQGIQDVRGGDIILIDTENRAERLAGVQVTNEEGRPIGRPLAFHIVPFPPPFRADRYQEAIAAQLPRKPACVIVDSMSDEHEGEGGRLDWHEKELDRILKRLGIDKNDWGARERNSMSAWRPSSAARQRLALFINSGMGETPLLLTFRAREKTKPMKERKNGRDIQVPTNLGYTPIAPAEIVHSLDIMCLLPARADGLPLWRSDHLHQDFVLKLPQQFRQLFQEGQRITPAIGAALARWAKGNNQPPAETTTRREETRSQGQPRSKRQMLFDDARDHAQQGREVYLPWLEDLPEPAREALDAIAEELIALLDAAEGKAPKAEPALPGIE